MTLTELNNNMVIAKLDDVKFKCKGGYMTMKGYALKHSEYGYISINDYDKHGNLIPYIPCGGKLALKEILKTGFISLEDIQFVKPLTNI